METSIIDADTHVLIGCRWFVKAGWRDLDKKHVPFKYRAVKNKWANISMHLL